MANILKQIPQIAPQDDYSDLTFQIRFELRRIGESIYGDRVRRWCDRAGYKSIHHLDKPAMESLLKKLQSIS